LFRFTKNGLEYFKQVKDDIDLYKIAKDMLTGDSLERFDNDHFSFEVYDLMDGKEFIQDVENGCFTNDDGWINAIYVDGYKSNLGIAEGNLQSGELLMDGESFRDLCEDFEEVKVDWVNK
jgi:hypothetical protein